MRWTWRKRAARVSGEGYFVWSISQSSVGFHARIFRYDDGESVAYAGDDPGASMRWLLGSSGEDSLAKSIAALRLAYAEHLAMRWAGVDHVD
jgi:hypothetical protein